MAQHWDYIIVGAGAAGCVLAHRLSADPKRSVLLIEAGPPDRSPYIHIPAAIVKLIGNSKYDWAHLAAADPTRNDRVDLWPAGKTLGGSTSINGMLIVRGHPQDYDDWAALGATGWGFADVLPYFKRLEAFADGDDALRGRDGPMHVDWLRTTHPLAHVFRAAAEEEGLTFNDDYNGVRQFGVAYSQVTQKRGARFSAARAYLNPIKARPNLKIETGTRVDRLIFEGKQCTGVSAKAGDGRSLRFTGRETLLCAGALASPTLLMRSGVGPGHHLRENGVEVLVDAPEVGENLREHPEVMVSANVYRRTYNMELSGVRPVWHMANWLLRRRGPVTSPYPHCVAYFHTQGRNERPNVQVLFGPFAFDFDENGVLPVREPVVGAAYNITHPKSKGGVRLKGPGEAAPDISHAMFSDEDDMARMIEAGRKVRAIFDAPAFAAHRKGERGPGPDVESDDEWADYIRRAAFLGYHPIGTCRMGSDARAVATPELRVNGVERLRVVDASVMPAHVSANTNAAVLMIAEKASDQILRAAA
ncbi:MAG: GMC family oxidoreductase N-terminal domain-containing protein [Pseudomonadota bacterium]